MGNCCSKAVQVTRITPTIGGLKKAIDSNDLEEVKTYYSVASSESALIKHESASLSPLTYSFCKGSLSVFSFLISQGESIQKIIHELAFIQTTPLILLCEKEYQELLLYFLPLYDSLAIQSDSPSEELSVFKPTNTKIPIHILCEKGNLKMIQAINKHYTYSKPPFELDVHSIDPLVGNNGALSSIKSGNLELIKYLFYDCKGNFLLLNKHAENALVLAAVWSKNNLNANYLPIFKFLIEKAKVKINENYEETLLILESHSIVVYFVGKLKEIGIEASKLELEKQNKLVYACSPKLVTRRQSTLKFQADYIEKDWQSKDSGDSSISIIQPVNLF